MFSWSVYLSTGAEEIQTVLDSVPLDVLQLHGDETPEQCQQIALHCKRRWYKAIQVKPDLDILTEIQRYRCGSQCWFTDAWHPDLKGGTGHCFDWNKFPKLDIPLISGRGLTPENVSDAIDTTAAFAVDVSGGVESAKV